MFLNIFKIIHIHVFNFALFTRHGFWYLFTFIYMVHNITLEIYIYFIYPLPLWFNKLLSTITNMLQWASSYILSPQAHTWISLKQQFSKYDPWIPFGEWGWFLRFFQGLSGSNYLYDTKTLFAFFHSHSLMSIQWHCILMYFKENNCIFQNKIKFGDKTCRDLCISLFCGLIFFFVFNIMHWPFRKCWFSDLCISSKCWHISLYNIYKITLITITTDLKSPQYCIGWWLEISEILTSAWKFEFYCCQQILSVAFFEVTDTLFILNTITAKYSNLNKLSLNNSFK